MQVREWTVQTNPIYRKHLTILLSSTLLIYHFQYHIQIPLPPFHGRFKYLQYPKEKTILPFSIKMNSYNSKSKIHNLTRQLSNTTHTPLIISQTSCKHYNPSPILNQLSLKTSENISHTNSLQTEPRDPFQRINTPWRFFPFSYFLDQNRWETKIPSLSGIDSFSIYT